VRLILISYPVNVSLPVLVSSGIFHWLHQHSVFLWSICFSSLCLLTTALIWILHTTTQFLSDHDYVIIIALEFSKPFDTVRHSALFDKFADLEIPDNVYNWLVEFFQGHSHCTRYVHRTSALRARSASIVQCSAIGPASYIITASDLTTTIAGNARMLMTHT